MTLSLGWTLLLLISSISSSWGELEPLLNDLNSDEGRQSLFCPGQIGTFTCTVPTSLLWSLNDAPAFQFIITPGTQTMAENAMGAASVVKIEDEDLTSVLILDPFPVTDFNVSCNQFQREIKFLAMPRDPEDVEVSTCIIGEFVRFEIAWRSAVEDHDVLITGHQPLRVTGGRFVTTFVNASILVSPVQITIKATSPCGTEASVTESIIINNTPCAAEISLQTTPGSTTVAATTSELKDSCTPETELAIFFGLTTLASVVLAIVLGILLFYECAKQKDCATTNVDQGHEVKVEL